MNSKQTVPLLTTIAPAALVSPPVALVVLLGVGLLWLLSKDEKAAKATTDAGKPTQEAGAEVPQASKPITTAKKVTREDLAEALAYGERRLTRKEAVTALEALGFRKTSAYKALAQNGRFASLIEFTPDGLIEWKG